MYEENEYDWTVLKNYKQDKRNKLNNKIKATNKLNKGFKKQEVELSAELIQLNAQ